MLKNLFFLLLFPCFVNAQNLIRNGDFEKGNIDFKSQYKFTTCKKDSNNCGRGAFMCNGSFTILGEPAACNAAWSAKLRDHTTGQGKMLIADFSSNELMLWQQMVEIEAGVTYRFQVWGLNLTDFGTKPLLVCYIDSTLLSPNFVVIKNEWQPYEAKFTAKKTGKVSIRLKNTTTTIMGCDLAIDDIRFEATNKKTLPVKKVTPTALPIQWYLANSRLRPESFPVLDSLVLVLQKNPNLKLTLISHTDMRGSATFNLKISAFRSKRVVDYLIQKGIAADRLTAKGMGESAPLIECSTPKDCTEAQHQQNRRTEFLLE